MCSTYILWYLYLPPNGTTQCPALDGELDLFECISWVHVTFWWLQVTTDKNPDSGNNIHAFYFI